MPPSGPHTSLRRAEAESRARTITVTQMVVELDLTSAAPEQGFRSPAPDRGFASTTTISFDLLPAEDNAKQPEPEDVRDSTFVDFRGEELLSATLNGEELPASSWRAGRIELSGLLPSNTLVVRGKMAYSTDGEGLHRHVDPADQRVYLYAMSFLDAAPRWFACFDQPDLKAPYELRVSAPAHWTVLGNGPSVATTPGHWRIRVDQPMSTYFVTLVAGPYTSVRDEHDGIPLGFHVRASLGDASSARPPT
jgi:aminopeptidase N